MKKKKGTHRGAILAISLILAALLLVLIYLERRLPSGENPPTPAAPRQELLAEDLVIRGCLFDLGVHPDQVRTQGRTLTVEAAQKMSPERIADAFAPLKQYGRLKVEDASRVQVTLNGHPWVVFFTYPSPPQARMAIIVDDMGLDLNIAKKLAALDADLTFSIMPLRPYTKETARYLHAKGKEVMLHLPMEGNGKNPGPGTIYLGMSPAEVRAILHEDLRSVPYIQGVNNHMGSKVTADRTIMTLVQRELKGKDLFFIDSLTTNRSVCGEVATQVGIRFNARDVFLDNTQSADYIKGQLMKLVAVARRYPEAIGICHPHPVTIAVLQEELPRLQREGLVIVRVSTFTRRHE